MSIGSSEWAPALWVLLSQCKSESTPSKSQIILTANIFRYAMNICICDTVTRQDPLIKAITDETIINICM
jgi:hypothetical protein